MGTSIHSLPQRPKTVLAIPQGSHSTLPLPAAPVSIHSLPAVPRTTLALPGVGVTLLPAGFVPYFPPEITVEATGEGTASVVVLGSLVAEANASSEGVSSVGLLPIQYQAAEAAGLGEPTAEVTTAESVEAIASSEGTSSVNTAVAIDALASGTGSVSVDTAVRIDAEASGWGHSTAEVTLVGLLVPMASGEGTPSVELVTFAPSGMNKNGSQTMSGSMSAITGWTADTANFPGSSLVGNGLVVQGGTDNGIIEVSWTINNSGFFGSSTITVQFWKNGSLFATPPTMSVGSGGASTVSTQSTGLVLAEGDVITVYASASTSSGIRTLQSGWLRITQP